jgi:5-methyltetrahydrofolate--homocysteine methyltransferase
MDVTLRKLGGAGVGDLTMVGAAVVSQEPADAIGAGFYAREALEAVARVRLLQASGHTD